VTDPVSCEMVNSIKDLGVIFDFRLNFRQHIQDKINKAYSMIGLIKRNFIHMDKHTFVMLYKSLVRTHIEYAVSVWCPYKKGELDPRLEPDVTCRDQVVTGGT